MRARIVLTTLLALTLAGCETRLAANWPPALKVRRSEKPV